MRRMAWLVLFAMTVGGSLPGCRPSEPEQPSGSTPPGPPQAPTPAEARAQKLTRSESPAGGWLDTGRERRTAVPAGAARGEAGLSVAGVVEESAMPAASAVPAAGPAMPMAGGSVGAGREEKMATPDAPAPSASPRSRSRAGAVRGVDSPSEPALQAGEVDDNRLFSKYLAYVGKYRAQSGEKKFDAAERYLIRVVDGEGRGLPDTPVRVEAVSGQIPLFRARTDSRGRAVFFPNAVGTDVPDTLRLFAAHGPGQEVRRNAQGGEWSLPVSGAKADAAGITLDLLFLVDTTGSMSEEIARVRDTIHSVSSRIKALPARPRLRLGIVLYRDRGDEYVTRRRPFTEDVNAFHSALKEVQADGGGDEPEDLNAGLQQAVEAMDWTPSRAVRLAFVIADAPPHLDYGDEYDYFLAAQRAAEKGIKLFGVSTVGTNDVGEYVFRQMALLTLGRFIFVTRGEGGGSAHHVDRSDYSVQQLDDLVCRLVSEELSGLAGGAQSAGGR